MAAQYTFNDQGEDVQVSVPVPDDTKPHHVSCSIKPSFISLSIATLDQPEVAVGELFQEVEPDECTWSIGTDDGKRTLTLTLSKREAVTGKHPRWLGLLRA